MHAYETVADASSESAADLAVDLTELDLTEEEAALLASLLEGDGAAGDGEPAIEHIERRPPAGPGVLSFAQERLWLLDQLEPGSTAYNMTFGIRLRGALDAEALRHALQAIVARHDTLRTSFHTDEGAPVAQVASQIVLGLPTHDLSALPPAERESAARLLAAEDARTPFDLTVAPLLRGHLIRLASAEYILILTFHHIVADGWSLDVFFRELAALYEGARDEGRGARGEEKGRGEEPGKEWLAPLPIQYADFAAWQREWLAGPVRDEQLAYWTRQLADAPTTLDLPTDRPRPARLSSRGAVHAFELPGALRTRLDGLARQGGATMYMVLLAGFAAVLARYSGQDDLVVGSPIAGRTRPEIEGLIGFFVNTLALWIDLSGRPTFRELIGRVRETTLGAFAHQDLPFEQVVEALHPDRDLSRQPLVQAMFVYQAASREPMRLGDLELSEVEIDGETAKFDLTLTVADLDDGARGFLEYSTDLFDAATIERLAGHLLTLLEAAGTRPDHPIGALPMLGAAERRELLALHAQTRPFAADRCLHEQFAEQARLRPDAVAVTCEAERLTYAELDERANRLAQHLRRLGVGPDVLVGLFSERSPDLLVAILGILKAGGAYLPIDPSYPADRIAFMLDDARAPVVLTQQALRDRLPETTATVLVLDQDRGADWPVIAAEPSDAPITGVTPEHLAYVIYTSGSTGRPKGVQITHANVARLFTATDDWYRFGPDDVWTLFHSYAFDFSVWEIWGALLYGGRLVVVPFWVSRSPDAFHALLAREGVTVLNQTPSAFRQLIAADAAAPPERALALRSVIFGGEALDTRTLLPWYARHADDFPRLINMYGITETTVHVTYRPLSRADAEAPSSPIGEPIPDLSLYLLDENLEPVPIGVPGELYVGGAGLARGYLNRPDLTAERFIRDPFSADPRARLYRSGDVARYLANGSLEFVGRADTQVKIRGFRIELGEIETVLGQHPAVRECIVLAREDAPGDQRLVAYVVGPEPTATSAPELRDFARQRLAEYMVPSAVVVLQAMPLTVNGKLDRKALPAPSAALADVDRAIAAPRDALERLLVEIWQAVLGVQPVGIGDNFFDLGGHSLLAVRLVAQIQARTGQAVPLVALFQGGTIEHLASMLRESVADTPAQPAGPLVPIQPNGSRPPFFWVHPSGGNVLCYADLARLLGPDQPFYGLQATDGQDHSNTQAHDRSIEAMAAHYLQAIRSVQPDGPYALGGWSFGGLVAFEMARQLQQAGQRVTLLALLDTQAPGAALDESDTDDAAVLSWLAGDLAEQAGRTLALPAEQLRSLDADAQVAYAADLMLGAGIELPDDGAAWVGRFLKGFRSRVEAAQRFAPEPSEPYDGQIVFFRAADSVADTGAWSALSTRPVVSYAVAGRHAEMVYEPHVQAIADRLRADLATLGAAALAR